MNKRRRYKAKKRRRAFRIACNRSSALGVSRSVIGLKVFGYAESTYHAGH